MLNWYIPIYLVRSTIKEIVYYEIYASLMMYWFNDSLQMWHVLL